MPVPVYTGSVFPMPEMEFVTAGALAGPGAGNERL